MLETLKAIEWDLIALDESHNIKWPTTKQSQASIELRDAASKRLVLTGTPIANTPLDVYSQLEFLGKGFSGFMSWKAFRTFYGSYVKTGPQQRDKLVGLQNLPFMKERLARYSFIISKEEALPDLPTKVFDVLEAEMTEEQTKVYREVRDELVTRLEQELDAADNKTLVINNVLTQLLRLGQITSGFVSFDAKFDDEGNVISDREIYFFDPDSKLDLIVEVLKEKEPNEKTIIWSCWVPAIQNILRRLDMEGINAVAYYGRVRDKDRDEVVRKFNYDRDVKVLVGNQACGGAGLNLLGYPPGMEAEYETNCDHHIYHSQDWSMIKRDQSSDRSHRRGTRVPVRITDLCVPGTIDEEIRARVTKKMLMAYEISDVKAILKAVLQGVLKDE
jgi:SNF2 family DNA or RNA helicase